MLVDTNILGASLSDRRSDLVERYVPMLRGRRLMASFMTEAELRFGAREARWGRARRERLDALLDETQVVWPRPSLTRTYVELRLHCHRKGHGLAGRTHEADRWIAATALWLGLPLVTHDRAFLGIDGLDILTRLG